MLMPRVGRVHALHGSEAAEVLLLAIRISSIITHYQYYLFIIRSGSSSSSSSSCSSSSSSSSSSSCSSSSRSRARNRPTACPQTENLDVQGFDSSRFVMSRGGIPRSTGNFPEI